MRPISHRKPRGRGRPPAADTSHRERLLDAAIACYAADGIAATSSRSIAARAGVTPALVNYYFGSKERLLAAFVDERLLPALHGLREHLSGAGDDPREAAAAFVRGIHSVVAAQSWLPALWVREVLTENGALRGALLGTVFPMIPAPLAQRFAAAQQAGRLPNDLDPRLLVVSLMALAMFPLAAESIWRGAFDAQDIDRAALVSHTLALIDHGLGGTHGD